MNPAEYENMFLLECSHWWYQGLDDLLLKTISGLSLKERPAVLDAGCGTGRILAQMPDGLKAWGIDLYTEALDFCRRRSLENLSRGGLTQLPYRTGAFDLIVCIDVLYHAGIEDDKAVLREFCRVLKPGGWLVLHVAALEWLRGPHDDQVRTRERYTRSNLNEKVRTTGLHVKKSTYRMFFLFPFFAAARLWSRLLKKRGSDLSETPPWINRVLFGLLRLENRWLMQHALPIGSSLFMVASKKR